MAIDWKINDYKQGAGRNYSAAVKGDYLERKMLQEVWRFFATTVMAENAGLEWDYLRIEFWIDSGHVAMFPASVSKDGSVARVFAYVVFDRLLEQYERLADSELDDDQFSAEIHTILETFTLAFEQAAKTLDLAGLTERSWVRIRLYEAGEEQALSDFVVPEN